MQGNDLKTEMSIATEKEVMYVTELSTKLLLYGSVSQELGTTKFTNLIG